MSKYCPIVDHFVTYQFCQECERKLCSIKPNKNVTQIIKKKEGKKS